MRMPDDIKIMEIATLDFLDLLNMSLNSTNIEASWDKSSNRIVFHRGRFRSFIYLSEHLWRIEYATGRAFQGTVELYQLDTDTICCFTNKNQISEVSDHVLRIFACRSRIENYALAEIIRRDNRITNHIVISNTHLDSKTLASFLMQIKSYNPDFVKDILMKKVFETSEFKAFSSAASKCEYSDQEIKDFVAESFSQQIKNSK